MRIFLSSIVAQILLTLSPLVPLRPGNPLSPFPPWSPRGPWKKEGKEKVIVEKSEIKGEKNGCENQCTFLRKLKKEDSPYFQAPPSFLPLRRALPEPAKFELFELLHFL